MSKSLPRWISFSLLGLLSSLWFACGGEPAKEESGSPGPAETPQRIVAIAPSVTEMLFELGLGDRVVGVGDYTRWPPEATARPKLGGLFDSRLVSDPIWRCFFPVRSSCEPNWKRWVSRC
jgi:ABC-type hemin transport system substrate-binding protein